MECRTTADLVDERISKVITQYRESPKLLHMIKTDLEQLAEPYQALCTMLDYFDLDTAVGDQLTILGKALGFPRCHCICDVQPVFGFDCEGVISDYPIAGFCDEAVTWVDCGIFGYGDICIEDDELYRKFLQVRVYQHMGFFSLEHISECVKIFWGEQATVLAEGHGRVVIAPLRDLTNSEIAVLQLYPRVLPIALGIVTRFHFGEEKVFGFGEGWGGFCEPYSQGEALITEDGQVLATENGEEITTGVLTEDAPWLCEIDVNPYSC